jgi:hypothetical protein
MKGRDPIIEIPRILAAIESARRRSSGERERDIEELAGLLAA